MRAATFLLSLALAALASADDNTTSSIPYSNPATSFLTQTDSRGVITGQPALVTSQPGQPGLMTSQPSPASIYAGLSQGLNTVVAGNRTLTVNVSGNATSVVTPTPTSASSAGSGSGSGSGSTASKTSATTAATSSGAAAPGNHIKIASGALAGAGAVFALFL